MPLDLSAFFRGRLALICGAGGGGIGAATSLMLSAAGARILAVDQSAGLVNDICARIRAQGGDCLGIEADLRLPRQAADVVNFAVRETGSVDLVINIAGGTQKGEFQPLEQTPDEVYQNAFALNLDYVFRICRNAAKIMIENGGGGAIVNVASVSGLSSAPYHGPYGAAKAAVMALTRTMAVEWGRYGIRANCVAPGSTRTARSQRHSGALDARAKDWAPLQRPVESREVAATIAFLLSDAASAITGQTIAVDCGVTARSSIGGIEVFSTYS